MIDDLIKLETEGIEVSGWSGKTLGAVATVLTDNLGAHQVGGFCQSFGTVNCFCRVCMAKKSQFHDDNWAIGDFERRNPGNYKEQLALYLSGMAAATTYGVTSQSILNRLTYGHATSLLPPCIAHDLGEGKHLGRANNWF